MRTHSKLYALSSSCIEFDGWITGDRQNYYILPVNDSRETIIFKLYHKAQGLFKLIISITVLSHDPFFYILVGKTPAFIYTNVMFESMLKVKVAMKRPRFDIYKQPIKPVY